MSERYLSELYIYPIKSLPGVRVEQAFVEGKGLRHDRRWMLVDNKNRFMTLRKYPKLYDFEIGLESGGIIVSAAQSSIQLPYEWEGAKLKTKVWDDEVEVQLAKDDWSKWFSDKLDMDCRLVFFSENSERPIKEKWQANGEMVSLADGYPYLIVGQSSVDALSEKVELDLSIKRFRPNLVIKGGEAYEEFLYKDVKIGNVEFKGLKPCARCVVITIDPETQQRGKEPLKTLAGQKVNDKLVFGQHAVATKQGIIKTGDLVEIVSKKDSPYDPL